MREFRRQYGMIVSNSTEGGSKGTYSWDDFERTFGTDDTDACFIVCVHDPIASDYYDQFKEQVESGDGLCYGWATMAARFRGYGTGQKPSDYQRGATRAWDVTALQEGTLGKRDVVRWFVAQFDKGMQDDLQRGKGRSYVDERTLLKDLIAQQGAAMLSIRQGDKGHAITAYGVRDAGDGGMLISVYDPNIPYQRFEETDKATRIAALGNSTVTVNPNGSWSYAGLGWKGDNSTLVVKGNIPPLNANLPSTFSLASLFSSAGGPPPAEVTGIESGGRPQLDSDGEPTGGSGVALSPVLSGPQSDSPQYQLKKGREYELTIKGTAKGRYDSSLLTGSSTASVRSIETAKGQIDRVTVRPGESSLQFATGASRAGVVYDLKQQRGKVTRTAAITTTAREGGSDEAELNGGTLRIAHDGAPTRVAITLGSVGAGLPANGETAPMTIGRDQRLDITPRSWSSLTSGVRYTLRAQNGRVIRRGNVSMRGSSKVALGKVSAKRSGRKLTVTGSVAKRGSAPMLAAVATVTKGGKVVRRKTAKLSGAKVKKGRFSLPITIGSVPKGSKVTAEVVLADPTGGGASVRKAVRVR